MKAAREFHPVKSKYVVFTADYLLPFLIIIMVLFLGYLVRFSPYFTVTNVICNLDYQQCSDPNLLVELDRLKGENIFSISSDELSSRLTSGDFTIRQAQLKRTLPGTVTLDLQSVYPVIALQVVSDSQWIVLDQQNRVIGVREEDPNVPTVLVPGPLSLVVGKQPSDPVLIQTLDLAKRLFDELYSVKTITLIDADTINLTLGDDLLVVMTPKRDEQLQLRSLQAVLSDATISKGVRIIDVRFERPVLR